MKMKGFGLALLFGRKAANCTLLKGRITWVLGNSLLQASSRLQTGSTTAAHVVPLTEDLVHSSGFSDTPVQKVFFLSIIETA